MAVDKLTSIENYINNYNISFDINDKMTSLVLPPMDSFRQSNEGVQQQYPMVKTEQVVPKLEELTPPSSPASSEASSEAESVKPTGRSGSKYLKNIWAVCNALVAV